MSSLLPLLLACHGPPIGEPWYVGTGLPDAYFPFDGVRQWTYASTTRASGRLRVATLRPEPEVGDDGGRVYVVDTVVSCLPGALDCDDGALVHTLRWRSDDDVVLVGVEHDGLDTRFDPPIPVVTRDQLDDEDRQATAGEWTSTLASFPVDCPVQAAVDWGLCVELHLTRDGQDGAPLSGRWWAYPGFGVVAMELDHEEGRWELFDHACLEQCDGVW